MGTIMIGVPAAISTPMIFLNLNQIWFDLLQRLQNVVDMHQDLCLEKV